MPGAGPRWKLASRAKPRAAVLAAALLGLGWAASGRADADPDRTAWKPDPAAQALLGKMYRNLYEGDFVQVIRLTSQSSTGRAVTRRMQIVRKESEPPGRAVVRFLAPEEIRGTSMLVIEQSGRTDDVFIYLPAFRKTKRLSSAQRYDSFFGTNLTYEDMEPKDQADFEARLDGHAEVAGVRCLKLLVRPRPETKSQYDLTVSCVDPERAVALWTEYYAESRLIKRLDAEPDAVQPRSGRFVPSIARLSSEDSTFVTEIRTESYEFPQTIPDSLFSTWNLEAGDQGTDLEMIHSAVEREARRVPPRE